MNSHHPKFTLLVVLIALLCPQGLVRAQNASPTPAAVALDTTPPSDAGEKVKLYYMREATKINVILTAIATPNDSVLNGLIMKNVFSESLVLTTSFITPTSMGIAVLYPTELRKINGPKFNYNSTIYDCQWKAVSERRAVVVDGQTCEPKS